MAVKICIIFIANETFVISMSMAILSLSLNTMETCGTAISQTATLK